MAPFLGEASTPRAIFFWLMGRSAEVLTLGMIAWRLLPGLTRNSSLFLGLLASLAIVAWGSWALRLDMHLPDMDGIEIMRRLRAMPGGLDQTVVSLSANALPQDQAQALAAGAADSWTKPLDLPGLASRLQKMLARAAADRALD